MGGSACLFESYSPFLRSGAKPESRKGIFPAGFLFYLKNPFIRDHHFNAA
jgi:hypothetical protein